VSDLRHLEELATEVMRDTMNTHNARLARAASEGGARIREAWGLGSQFDLNRRISEDA